MKLDHFMNNILADTQAGTLTVKTSSRLVLTGGNSPLSVCNDGDNMKSGKSVGPKSKRRLSEISLKDFETSNHKGLSRSLQFMAQNYTQPIQLGDVVQASGMSRRGFMKAFSRHIGRTPCSFIRQARIEFAKRLLIEQDLPLKAIAAIIGFRSENTFCIAFNRITGLAPKKFQRLTWLQSYNGRSKNSRNGPGRKWAAPKPPALKRAIQSKKNLQNRAKI